MRRHRLPTSWCETHWFGDDYSKCLSIIYATLGSLKTKVLKELQVVFPLVFSMYVSVAY